MGKLFVCAILICSIFVTGTASAEQIVIDCDTNSAFSTSGHRQYHYEIESDAKSLSETIDNGAPIYIKIEASAYSEIIIEINALSIEYSIARRTADGKDGMYLRKVINRVSGTIEMYLGTNATDSSLVVIGTCKKAEPFKKAF